MSNAPNTKPAEPQPSRNERLMSIDALRGFDMIWIVGGDSIAQALGKWLGTPEGASLAEQFEHVDWEGFRFYDLIFPLFLFTGRRGLAVLACANIRRAIIPRPPSWGGSRGGSCSSSCWA